MRHCSRLVATLAVVSLVTAAARCQQMVADLRLSTNTPPSGNPTGLLALPGFVAFRATTLDSGAEPWVTDGSAGGTFRLRDLVPGSLGSSPVMLGAFQGEAVFAALVPGSGAGLYRTDGTTAGTRPIGNLGVAAAATGLLTLANGNALLLAGGNVYATDLTQAGTQQIPGMQQFLAGVELGGVLLGTCQGPNNTIDLWATDGTVAGSRLVQAGISNQRPTNFVVRQGRACFVELAGNDFFVASTDGQSVVRHVLCGSFLVTRLGRLEQSGNRLMFLVSGLGVSSQLLASDLTAAGTGLVPLPCLDLGELTEFGGALYVRGTTATQGYELWTTDGTTAGTTQVADLIPGVDGSHPEQLRSTPHGLFFRTRDGQGGYLLRMLSSPTNVRTVGPIALTALNANVVPWQDGLLFSNSDSAGTELWFGGATRATARVVDIDATAPGLVLPSQPSMAAVRERLFFHADDGVHGMEPWASDGSATGTNVLDLSSGSVGSHGGSTASAQQLTSYRDRLAFCGRTGTGLSDGTAGNVVGLNSRSNTGPVRVVDQHLYFVSASQLWRSDGTPGGTQVIPGMGNVSVADFRVLSGHIVLLSSAENVWGTDGVSYPLLLQAGAARLLGTIDGRVVFSSSVGLHTTDGTVAGTVQLASGSFSPFSPIASGEGVVYARALDGTVWKSDGTAAGTAPVAPVPPGMVIETLVATASKLFVVATTPATGRELWQLDASSGQFVLVADLAPGVTSGVAAASALGRGDLVFLAAGDETTGSELYVSDGTVAGTYLVGDLSPGRASSNPRLLGIADAQVFFTANDGVHGNELWVMPAALVGAAQEQEIGFGCAGSAGVPVLATTAAPRLGASGFGYAAERLPGLAPVLFGIATDDAVVPLGGCALHLGGTIATQFRVATVAGTASVALPVPASQALLGLRLAAQAFALDGLAPAGFAASSGRLVVVGR